MEHTDVDKTCQLLGPFKRYQIFQIVYTSFGCLLSLAYPVLIYVFAGKKTRARVTLLTTRDYLLKLKV